MQLYGSCLLCLYIFCPKIKSNANVVTIGNVGLFFLSMATIGIVYKEPQPVCCWICFVFGCACTLLVFA